MSDQITTVSDAFLAACSRAVSIAQTMNFAIESEEASAYHIADDYGNEIVQEAITVGFGPSANYANYVKFRKELAAVCTDEQTRVEAAKAFDTVALAINEFLIYVSTY